jgi:hypothetical protein
MSGKTRRRAHLLRVPSLIAAISLTSACTHVVRVPIDCGPAPEPIGRSAIGWERVAGASRVSGKVLSPSLAPLAGTTVDLVSLPPSPSRSSQSATNTQGEFAFESTLAGRYVLRARRLGYSQVRDTIQLRPDSGAVATILLVQDKISLDDCGLTYTEKRVPWWHR